MDNRLNKICNTLFCLLILAYSSKWSTLRRLAVQSFKKLKAILGLCKTPGGVCIGLYRLCDRQGGGSKRLHKQ
uniref:Uncharacterized protein n=1 Tax=Anguilla anguilla TaxID=7936 RepID=A0A0E9SKX3_ANGAN